MKIGIFLKGGRLPERFNRIAQKIIYENNELITELKIATDYGFIRTNVNTYHMVRTGNNTRGCRFEKAYFDLNTTLEDLHEVIYPCVFSGDVELIYQNEER